MPSSLSGVIASVNAGLAVVCITKDAVEKNNAGFLLQLLNTFWVLGELFIKFAIFAYILSAFTYLS